MEGAVGFGQNGLVTEAKTAVRLGNDLGWPEAKTEEYLKDTLKISTEDAREYIRIFRSET